MLVNTVTHLLKVTASKLAAEMIVSVHALCRNSLRNISDSYS